MRKCLLIIFIYGTSINACAQSAGSVKTEKARRLCLTLGILQGGGSLIGADLEFLVTGKLGVQGGAGYIGYGAGLNYHLKPSIHSSFISFQYWNQGIGDSFAQNAIGATYAYRSKKWFTCQIGLGVPLRKGPVFPEDFEQPPVMLMFSFGAFILM